MRLKRTATERLVARQVGGTRSTVQSTGNSTPTAFVRLRRICGMTLLSALLLSHAQAQPRISLHIQRRAFNGNLLKCADGTFIAGRKGELHRLTATGAYERKLGFDPTHPVAAFTADETYFKRIFAPLADGGFFAIREQMVQHRSNAMCAGCHAQLDPIGLSLENSAIATKRRWTNIWKQFVTSNAAANS